MASPSRTSEGGSGALYNPPPVMNSQTKILSFEVIPVIDLIGGQVVQARRGQRDQYQPVVSTLSKDASPLNIVHGLLALYPFKSLYIADLDAIRQQGNHHATVAAIQATFPQLQLWVDAGFSHIAQCQPWQTAGVCCIIGSESLPDIDSAKTLIKQLGSDAILSLDSHNGLFKGPASLLQTPQLWPSRIIAMNLDHVGSNSGPDMPQLTQIRQQQPQCQLYAAGGVRHTADLQMLHQAGIAGALIASALHNGRISADDLFSLHHLLL